MRKLLVLTMVALMFIVSGCENESKVIEISDSVAKEKLDEMDIPYIAITDDELLKMYDVLESHTLVNSDLKYFHMFALNYDKDFTRGAGEEFDFFSDEAFAYLGITEKADKLCNHDLDSENLFDLRLRNADNKLFFTTSDGLEYLIYKVESDEFQIRVIEGEAYETIHINITNETIFYEENEIINAGKLIEDLFSGKYDNDNFIASNSEGVYYYSYTVYNETINEKSYHIVTYDAEKDILLSFNSTTRSIGSTSVNLTVTNLLPDTEVNGGTISGIIENGFDATLTELIDSFVDLQLSDYYDYDDFILDFEEYYNMSFNLDFSLPTE